MDGVARRTLIRERPCYAEGTLTRDGRLDT